MAKPYSYISNMYNQNGPEWVLMIRPEDIQRNTKRIIKDMVKGTIPYEEVGSCFLDLKFLENLIIGVKNELEINGLNYTACCFMFEYYPNYPNLGAHITHLDRVMFIYNTILAKLEAIKITGDIGCLADISSSLYNLRNHLN